MNCGESLSRRCRTRFNSWQVERLERVFHKTHYPDTKQMEKLSLETKIPTQKMQIWFQNRRAKWRKNSRLKNFGGLASVTETEYVPAPNYCDTIKSFANINEFENISGKEASVEKYAIDLRMPSMKEDLSSYLMANISSDKSNAYKKTGGNGKHTTNETTNGITNNGVVNCLASRTTARTPTRTPSGAASRTPTRTPTRAPNPHLSDHMNAFEYPSAYYSRRNTDNADMPFTFASNQTTITSLLLAPHLYSLCVPSTLRESLDINK